MKRFDFTDPNWKPREKLPNEALPRAINLFALPRYVPPKNESVRAGADDHLKIKSRFGNEIL